MLAIGNYGGFCNRITCEVSPACKEVSLLLGGGERAVGLAYGDRLLLSREIIVVAFENRDGIAVEEDIISCLHVLHKPGISRAYARENEAALGDRSLTSAVNGGLDDRAVLIDGNLCAVCVSIGV